MLRKSSTLLSSSSNTKASSSSSSALLPSFVPSIWVAGLNWHSHATEVGFPIPQQPIFCMKSPTSLLYPEAMKQDWLMNETNNGSSSVVANKTFCGKFGNKIFVPKMVQLPAEVDYEGELAVVLGARVEQGALQSKEDVIKHQNEIIAGYTCSMDITARRWQGKKGGGQWCIAKSFDTWCPLGPQLMKLPLDQIPNLSLQTKLNGKVVQQEKFDNFIFDVATLVHFLNQVSTLLPGMIILTGTPAGVGFARKAEVRSVGTDAVTGERKKDEGSGGNSKGRFVADPYYLVHGDRLEVTIDEIGSLRCIVEHEGREGEARLPI